MENIFQIAILFKAIDNATSSIKNIQKATQLLASDVEKATAKFKALGDRLEAFEERATSLQSIAGAAVWSGAFAGMIKSFTELENASLSLQATFMETGGVIPEVFHAVDREAKKLGAELPGSTDDFYRLAAVMKQLGVEGEVLAKGGLRAAAYLGAVLKIPYEEAGFYVAKFSQSLGIAQQDLISFMDTVQRLGHLGVKVSEMNYSFSKLSGALKILGWQGLEMSNELAPLVGRFIQLGYSGETVGTNLSSLFLSFLNPEKINKFNAELSKFGIHLNLIDERTGKLKGPAALIAELDKISQLYKEGIISQAELFSLLSKLTGASGEDLKMLATLVMEGAEGYNKMNEAMARQASLQKRVEIVTKSLANVWEAFTGTAKNLFALLGSTLAPTLKRIADFLNNVTDATTQFFEKHKTLASILGWTVGILAGVSAGFVALGLIITALLFPLRILITTLQIVGPVLRTLTILIGNLGKVFISTLWKMTLALFTTPIGWVILGITALVAAGYFLYRNWDKVVKALSSAWNFLRTNWQKVLQVFLWINPITAPVMALNKLVKYIFGIDLFSAGKKIIESLWRGIQSVAMKPVEAVKNIVSKIRNLLPFSPAKEGPLTDLHKVKIVETIAQTIVPSPIVAKMRKILEPIKGLTYHSLMQPVRLAGAGAISIVVNLGGINISGKVTEKEAREIALNIQQEIEKVLARIETAKFRRSY